MRRRGPVASRVRRDHRPGMAQQSSTGQARSDIEGNRPAPATATGATRRANASRQATAPTWSTPGSAALTAREPARATPLITARTSSDTQRQVITPTAATFSEALPAQPLAWAAFMPPRQTQPARRPRLDGVPVRDPGEAQHRRPLSTQCPRATSGRRPLYVAMTGDRTDLYAVLGLTSRATQEELARAYRTLLRQNHPDTRPMGNPSDDAASNLALQEAMSAYSVLGDPARRARYDQHILRRTSTSIRVHPAFRVPSAFPELPPIQAGPVRWHGSR